RDGDGQSSPLPLAWARVAHVSRRWRQVALGCPKLWRRICLWYPSGWVEAMLQRSASAPLVVRASYGSLPTHQDAFKAILAEAQRLQSFNLEVEPWPTRVKAYIVKEFLGQLTIEMPVLESFVLQRDAGNANDPFLPKHFLGASSPQLKHLSLLGWVPLSWKAPTFQRLQSLRVECESYQGHLLLSILEGLASMQELSDLALRLRIRTDPLPSHLSVVQLPHLQSLRVHFQSICALAILLEHLAIRPTAKMAVSCFNDSRDNSATLKILAQSLHSSYFSDPLL
ncbi:hypothetical protein BKA70DRAFT_823097, partial [Coprinopsis sp. MPI-PUGE-AT-0042]